MNDNRSTSSHDAGTLTVRNDTLLTSLASALQAALKLAITLPEAARRGADLTVVALKSATTQLQSALATLRDADAAL